MSTTKTITALTGDFTYNTDYVQLASNVLQLRKKYPDVTDLASGLTPTSTSTLVNPTNATDGDFSTYAYITGGGYIQVDLGSEITLRKLLISHLYTTSTGRQYTSVVVQVSTDNVSYTTIFNNDVDNVWTLGAGTDALYYETATGKEILIENGIACRYIRWYCKGSNIDTGTAHFAVIEAYKYTYPVEAEKIITVDTWRANTNNFITPFAATVSETGSDSVKFQIIKDDVAYFWDGTEWLEAVEESIDYANTASELSTNLPTLFDTPNPVLQKLNIYLFSSDGTTTPTFTDLTIKYDIDTTSSGTGQPATRKLYGFVYDSLGAEVSGAKVELGLSVTADTKVGNVLIKSAKVNTTTDEDGYFELTVIPTADMTPETALYTIKIPDIRLVKSFAIPTGTDPIDLGIL